MFSGRKRLHKAWNSGEVVAEEIRRQVVRKWSMERLMLQPSRLMYGRSPKGRDE